MPTLHCVEDTVEPGMLVRFSTRVELWPTPLIERMGHASLPAWHPALVVATVRVKGDYPVTFVIAGGGRTGWVRGGSVEVLWERP